MLITHQPSVGMMGLITYQCSVHARKDELVGQFLPHTAFNQKEFGATTKHARRGEMTGHLPNSINQTSNEIWVHNAL
jgi:hypothetical protein